ncbi:hypothetical protein OKA06_19180 [Novosphingobium sp. MW5]|nr:hypothetical protein [Novosphingobium sp. MW5]
MILLTAAPHFLAQANGASFPEVAQRLARPWRTLERSGIDF